MGIIARNEQEKSHLATEICEIWARAIACSNLHQPHTNKSPFINWYLVLRVNENSDIYGIRKQYHKLALQLHPDKNKHSKAETAFKLVSEAYFCLSDSARRASFDSERHTFSCIKCNTIPSCTNIDPTNVKTQKQSHQETSRFSRINRRMKELRTKLKEEANTIEKCLIANIATASRREFVNANRGAPVFNPWTITKKGSPQFRTINHKKIEDLRAGFRIGNKCMHDRAMNSSPVFQYRSERSAFMSRCASTRDR
ncbi:hypothetical protein DH2020_019163 [Rehmannia glutinosa]|uniref:J domain-containing protein n=1 Tax=Rehmannia glutinosa TaxID=99300 RepID=A0ABR0WL18_REHGL